MKGNHPVVGIFGHYGNRNLGDESIIEASIQQVLARLPDAEICCFSLRPDDTARRHGRESYRIAYSSNGYGPILPEQAAHSDSMPWKVYESELALGNDPDDFSAGHSPTGLKDFIKGIPVLGFILKKLIAIVHLLRAFVDELGYLANSFKYVRKFDLVVVAGSNQFLDNFGGPWAFPYTLLKWSVLCRMTRTKIAFASIGTNPLEHTLSKRMIRTALRLASYVSYRDEASRKLIEGDKDSYASGLYPDLAFGLESRPIAKGVSRSKLLIGLNPMPVYDYRYWCVDDASQYRIYVTKLARFAERLIVAGYPVIFFSTMWRDDYVIVDIVAEMAPELRDRIDKQKMVRRCEEVSELIALLEDIDIVVATRFHATLLPLLVNTPVLGISYYRKNIDLMNAFGQGNYHEVLEDCDIDRLWGKLEDLSRNRMREKEKIRVKTAEYKQLTGEQWDRIVQLVAG